MKPEYAADKRDFVVRRVPHREARSFILEHHYARSTSNTSTIAHGLFLQGIEEIFGAAMWMPPTRTCAESVSGKDDPEAWKRVLSLSRFACIAGLPTNSSSLFLGCCMRDIRREGVWQWLVTYADESQHHKGILYRATNWQYEGLTKKESRWLDREGRQVSRKTGPKTRTAAEMLALGYIQQERTQKHKFSYDLRKK